MMEMWESNVHTGIWTSVHNDVVQNLMASVRLMSVIIITFFADKFLYQVAFGTTSSLSRMRSHHRGFET